MISLLQCPKVSIVETRVPSNYTRDYTYMLANALAKRGVCIVSGAAMGVDGIAHEGAGFENTIAVVGNRLNICYPAVHSKMIEAI